MKNFVVGLGDLFNGSVKLFKVEAKDKYDAVKKAMVSSCLNETSREHELEWQNSEEYPKNWEELCSSYADFPFDIIEV